MAGWRQAVALAMTGEEIEALTALSRSRTEPAGRVSRAAMLLGYREKPSFFAVGRRLGVHHQTVQRCVERAMAYGALAALDDRPRPGKEPTITPEAKAWLVSLACDKAKEHGYPHELWTTRLLARHARARTGGGSPMSRPSGSRHRVQASRSRGNQAAQGALLSGTPRRRVRAQDGGSSVCLPRGPGPGKKPLPRRRNRRSLVAIVSYDEKPGNPGHRHGRHRICRQCQAAMRASRGIMSTNAMARAQRLKLAGDRICSPARSTRSSGSATAAASSSNSSSFSMPPIRPAPRSS